MTKRIFFIRHAQTHHNIIKRDICTKDFVNGIISLMKLIGGANTIADIYPDAQVNSIGHKQLGRLNDYVSTSDLFREEQITTILHSSMSRAIETYAAIKQSIPENVTVEQSEYIDELDVDDIVLRKNYFWRINLRSVL